MKTLNQEQLDALIVSFRKIHKVECSRKEELYYLFQLFSLFFESITGHQNISFTTLFSRIAFSSVHYNIKGALIRDNHLFRRTVEKGAVLNEDLPQLYKLGVYVLWQNLKLIYHQDIPDFVERPFIQGDDSDQQVKHAYRRVVKGYAIEFHDLDKPYVVYFDELTPHLKQICYLLNQDFIKQFKKIIRHVSLPFMINFIDVNLMENGDHGAKALVYKPDLLIGVTSISECFQSDGQSSLFYLSKKLLPSEYSQYMLIGNIVNYFLDELIHDSELNFQDLLLQIFQIAPLDFAKLNDDDLRDLLDKVETHFNNLKKVVKSELIDTGITKDKAYLEPSFYSADYGIQGRLDLYHFDSGKQQSDIVELKSGKLFKANGYGLNENHYVQTLLYDLIMESVHNGKVKSNNYILYSYLDNKRLKYAPRVRSKQYKALEIRNDIVILEDLLSDNNNDIFSKVIGSLRPDRIPENFNFLKRDSIVFQEFYDEADAIEQAYYNSFLAFINREFLHSKIGRHGVNESNGLASLWLDGLDEKIENFKILSYLEIEDNLSFEKSPLIYLKFTINSTKLSRFRVGDIAVFYPDDGSEKAVLRNQLFKCTIIEFSNERICIRLRARQKNLDVFQQFQFWHLETDVLDGGFKLQYDGLFNFLKSPKDFRRKILGLAEPTKEEFQEHYKSDKLTKKQSEVLNKAISSPDYFLLWGPPGTGKTSVMIKSLVDYYYNNTDLNIILLAYTNRAVDEICQAVDEVLKGDYIRIGSRYSTQEKFKKKLLSMQIETVKKRKDLQQKLFNNRVFISTVSSFQGSSNLSGIVNFDLVIIDEASQLLEPMLVGMLAQFKKYILIGDHKQLPAVVGQQSDSTLIKDTLLLENSSLRNMSSSLFERMFTQAQERNWDWCYGGLFNQGRMHQKIVDFASNYFYNGELKVMEGIERLTSLPRLVGNSEIARYLIENRMIFIDTPIDETLTRKTNKIEAEITSKIVSIWKDIYNTNNVRINDNSIGVITPFRSQIAMIAKEMSAEELEHVTLDTIERYQGGSRNQIIISLAISQAQLLDSISNVSEDGIDRKLNVALTRAKENVIILGSRIILEKKLIYKNLISYCSHLEYGKILNND